MNLPNTIIEAIELLPEASDRGQAYTAIISYLNDETEPEKEAVSPVAYAIFLIAKAELSRRIRRRKQAAARRQKNAHPIITLPEAPTLPIDEDADNLVIDLSHLDVEEFQQVAETVVAGRPLSRAQRRRIERARAKRPKFIQ